MSNAKWRLLWWWIGVIAIVVGSAHAQSAISPMWREQNTFSHDKIETLRLTTAEDVIPANPATDSNLGTRSIDPLAHYGVRNCWKPRPRGLAATVHHERWIIFKTEGPSDLLQSTICRYRLIDVRRRWVLPKSHVGYYNSSVNVSGMRMTDIFENHPIFKIVPPNRKRSALYYHIRADLGLSESPRFKQRISYIENAPNGGYESSSAHNEGPEGPIGHILLGCQILLGALGIAAGRKFSLDTLRDQSRSVLRGTGLRDAVSGLLCALDRRGARSLSGDAHISLIDPTAARRPRQEQVGRLSKAQMFRP